MDNDFQLRHSFGSKYQFPKKLMKVANDGILIRWTDDNGGLIVQEKEFEDNVMDMYPGFVQVGTFHNLRRLFRDYNFKFQITQNKYSYCGLQVEFRHPNFSRDNFHLLSQVKKRPRKSNYSYYKYQRQLITLASSSTKTRYKRKMHNLQSRGKRASGITRSHNDYNIMSIGKDNNTMQRELPISPENLISSYTPNKRNWDLSLTPGGIYELFSGAEMSPIVKPRQKSGYRLNLKYQESKVDCKTKRQDVETELEHDLWDKDQLRLLQVYANNELTEDEFWELITKKSCLPCSDMSWDMIKEYIDNVVWQELSPLHFKGYYYELSLSEM